MKGHIRQRGKNSWELKFDAGRDPATGRRRIQYVSFRGTKREAQTELAKKMAGVSDGSYVEPSKLTLAEFISDRIEQWAAAGDIRPKTAERYRQLAAAQIAPHVGALPLQRLKPFDLERWHIALANTGRRDGKGGLSARTIGHAHRIIGKALAEAAKNGLVQRNVAKLEGAPKVTATEVPTLTAGQVGGVLDGLRGRTLYPIIVIALFCGLRCGEILALRWRSVDLEAGTMEVVESLEQLQDGTLRFKATKTRAGARTVTLPDIVTETLREHRREQLRQRLALGLGKAPDVSKEWATFAVKAGIAVTLHGLRHSHASMLIDQGVDVVTISKRLGHASPAVTMTVYAHMFRQSDDKAARAINAALAERKPA